MLMVEAKTNDAVASGKQKNGEVIESVINQLDIINYDTVSQLIPKLIEEGSITLDPSVYAPLDSSTTEPRRCFI